MIELETKIAYLEKTVDELNEIVYAHQKQLDAMERLLKKVTERLNNPENGEDLPHTPPPHY
jgi:uncharacterized coiled-coil protein SlyX